ncbi:MAG: TIGR03792 family protein [Cytophagales bacterium]|nr:TIGR03792 family protein [Cytophagales bacterium]
MTHLSIEYLAFRIDSPELMNEYLMLDREIWDSYLKTHPAFHSKEVWLDPEDSAKVTFVVRWKDQSWKKIDPKTIEKLDAAFQLKFSGNVQFLEQKEFLQPSP